MEFITGGERGGRGQGDRGQGGRCGAGEVGEGFLLGMVEGFLLGIVKTRAPSSPPYVFGPGHMITPSCMDGCPPYPQVLEG